jgi:hypothetical protein
MLAAEAITLGRDSRAADAEVRARYEAALGDLKPRFAAYETANRVNSHPWLADLVIWRARRNERIMGRLSGVLDETHTPVNLVTARGLLRLFLPVG